MNASIISTGEELVRGRTVDTNAGFLAAGIERLGFQVRRMLVLGDGEPALREEVLRCAGDSGLIVVTGGLGPTADDRARWAIAEAAARPLTEDRESRDFLQARLSSFGRALNETQLSQAMFPEGSVVFPNPKGTARGFACHVGDAWLVAMPGVPVEMRTMFSESVVPFLSERLSPGGCVRVQTVNLFPIAEPDVDERIRDMMAPDRNPLLGITARDGIITVSVSARAPSEAQAEELLERDLGALCERFGDTAFGSGDSTLASAVSGRLAQRGLTIAVAESVTGGLIGHMLVEVPGISRFFLADIVAYDNEAKVRCLGVPRERIEAHGAVSPEVAESMALGICKVTGSDLGVSTTGIAGPSGATPEKPVGLVYVGLALGGSSRVARLNLRGDRERVRDRAAKHALHLARLALMKGVDALDPDGLP